MSLLKTYQNALASKEFMPDPIQEEAIKALDKRYHLLITQNWDKPKESSTIKGRLTLKPLHSLTKWFTHQTTTPSPTITNPIKGLYMWGGVGRGKTWMMDLFFNALPEGHKKRLHFHRFMQYIHDKLNARQGETDPINALADEIANETRILCFDEFFVSDITDAMILGTLLEALFKRGLILIATSNIPPDELYYNGLQRARFLPAISAIKQHCEIMNIDSGIDYRLRTLTQAGLFHFPLNLENQKKLYQFYEQLAGQPIAETPTKTQINHHDFLLQSEANGVALIDFNTLCIEARSAKDFIELSRLYHTIIVQNIKIMTAYDESAARRFIAMIDEFYERKVKLILSSEVSIDKLYQGERLTFEFQRCLSRLQEMQSEDYLAISHIP